MSINIHLLQNALKNIPVKIQREGERVQLIIPEKIDSLRAFTNYSDAPTPANMAYTYQYVTLIAVRNCRGENDCWLEWELESLN